MNFLHTLFAFLLALGVLIVFHELGHYWAARLCNVKVLRFSLGMGKVLLARRFGRDQTEWVVSAIPLGGYVKMLDVREQQEPIASAELAREFTHQSVWKRIFIVAAGPVANFILAIILFAHLFMMGVSEPIAKLRAPHFTSPAYLSGLRGADVVTEVNGKPIQLWSELRWEILQSVLEKQPARLTVRAQNSTQPQQLMLPLESLSTRDLEGDFLGKLGLDLALSPAKLGHAQPDSPAARAGLQPGDIVESINGKKIADSLDLIETVRNSPNKLLHIKVNRSGALLEFLVTPDAKTTPDGVIGRLKIEVSSMPYMVEHQDGWWAALSKAVQRTWETSVLTLKMIAQIIVGDISLKNLSGPLTVADYAGQTAEIGWASYISFIAFVSISLGVMNLLPIPVLDGGHLLYYALEILTGRAVSPRWWEISQRAGLVILTLLMTLALFNDLVRLFH
jgi:regulator of sigma E protease